MKYIEKHMVYMRHVARVFMTLCFVLLGYDLIVRMEVNGWAFSHPGATSYTALPLMTVAIMYIFYQIKSYMESRVRIDRQCIVIEKTILGECEHNYMCSMSTIATCIFSFGLVLFAYVYYFLKIPTDIYDAYAVITIACINGYFVLTANNNGIATFDD